MKKILITLMVLFCLGSSVSAEDSEATQSNNATTMMDISVSLASNTPTQNLTEDDSFTITVSCTDMTLPTGEITLNPLISSPTEGEITAWKPTVIQGDSASTSLGNGSASFTFKRNMKTSATFRLPVTFRQPGEYTFTITSSESSNAHLTQAISTQTVKYSVAYEKVDSPKLTVLAVENDGTNNDSKNSNSFITLQYKSADLYALTLIKHIGGNLAQITDSFDFTVYLSGNVAGSYDYQINDGTESGQTGIYSVDEAGLKVSLKANQSIVIKGLPAGTAYRIVESDKTGYKVAKIEEMVTKVVSNNGSSEKDTAEKETTDQETTDDEADTQNLENTADSSTIDLEKATIINPGLTDNMTVTYTNNAYLPPQTGILIDSLPYIGIGILLAAGYAGLLYFRRRTADSF